MLLESLEKQTGLSRTKLQWYAQTASARYKIYQIPKRTSGFRTIEQPSKQIKAIQRWLNATLISRFPVHGCATAYSSGSSIRENASRHVQTNFTLRADFADFFPSFQSVHVDNFLRQVSAREGISLNEADISFVRQVVCRHDALTIGAPSSPLLTNAMMFEFDLSLWNWCAERGMTYSRYADDLFVSTREPGVLSQALVQIRHLSSGYRFASLRANNAKTAFLSRRYRRSITGLVVTPMRTLSIGREKKTRLKSDIYAFKQQRLAIDEWKRVCGMLAFVSDVEPDFYQTLLRKYGTETIESLKSLRSVGGAVTDSSRT